MQLREYHEEITCFYSSCFRALQWEWAFYYNNEFIVDRNATLEIFVPLVTLINITILFDHRENKQNNPAVAFSPQADCTDWMTAAANEVVLIMRLEGVAWSVQHISTSINLSFLDQSRCFFFQVALHLSLRGWVDSGDRTQDL
jgi:hypothetical protein